MVKVLNIHPNFAFTAFISAYILLKSLIRDMSETESEYEPGSGSDSVAEANVPRGSRRENRSGDHRREEPTSWLGCRHVH